jgi:hypothetical protein
LEYLKGTDHLEELGVDVWTFTGVTAGRVEWRALINMIVELGVPIKSGVLVEQLFISPWLICSLMHTVPEAAYIQYRINP